MEEFVRGDAIPVRLDVQYRGSYADADSATVTVFDPSFTEVVNEVAMTRKSMGKYTYVYSSATDATPGVYLVHAWADVDSYNYGKYIKFKLIEG